MGRRPPVGMTAEEAYVDWDWLLQTLLVRCGGVCEARTVDCLAHPDGHLDRLPRTRVSIHHRLDRGMGGTRRTDVNDLPHVLLICGDGTVGCHGWIGRCPAAAEARGLWVRHPTDPCDVPLVLASGRIVALGVFYVTLGYDVSPPVA